MSQPVYPAFYEFWLAGRFPLRPTETLATCDQCAMVTPSGLTRDPGPFMADLKCCTYFPYVPNFSLGSLMSSSTPELQLRFSVAQQQGLFLPTGLHVAPEREELALHLGRQAFGQKRELLCPFFDTAANTCSVWKNRPGVCATYFCKSDTGEEGLQFWKRVEEDLNQFEWRLANEVLAGLGIGEDEIEMCKAALSIEESGEERDYFLDLAWGKWKGRQDEFYRQSLAAAKLVTQERLTEILGPLKSV